MNGLQTIDIILEIAFDPPAWSQLLSNVVKKGIFTTLVLGRRDEVSIAGYEKNKSRHHRKKLKQKEKKAENKANKKRMGNYPLKMK